MELKLKKNYLTIEEIGNIVNQCAEKHTSYECELIKTVLVAKYCLNLGVLLIGKQYVIPSN